MTANPFGLSARQVEVLGLAADGLSNPEIGARLGIATNTVKRHFARAGERIGCGDRTGMVARAYRVRLFAPEDEPGPAAVTLPDDIADEMVALARMVVRNQPLGTVRQVAQLVVRWADGQPPRPGRAA